PLFSRPALSGTNAQRILPELSSVKIRLGATPTVRLMGACDTAACALAAVSAAIPNRALDNVWMELLSSLPFISSTLSYSGRRRCWQLSIARPVCPLPGHLRDRNKFLCLPSRSRTRGSAKTRLLKRRSNKNSSKHGDRFGFRRSDRGHDRASTPRTYWLLLQRSRRHRLAGHPSGSA